MGGERHRRSLSIDLGKDMRNNGRGFIESISTKGMAAFRKWRKTLREVAFLALSRKESPLDREEETEDLLRAPETDEILFGL